MDSPHKIRKEKGTFGNFLALEQIYRAHDPRYTSQLVKMKHDVEVTPTRAA